MLVFGLEKRADLLHLMMGLEMKPAAMQRTYGENKQDPEHELMLAMEEYKRRSNRKFPTWSEVLEVILGLGYAKVEIAPVASDF
jgi:hypothetical protein